MNHYAIGRLKSREMNKTEAAYAQHLELRRRVGEIAWYSFEAMKLRLADNTTYTPDFNVMRADGTMEMHEVKGTTRRLDSRGIKQPRPFIQDDAAVKVKVASELFPFAFRVVFFDKASGWIELDY